MKKLLLLGLLWPMLSFSNFTERSKKATNQLIHEITQKNIRGAEKAIENGAAVNKVFTYRGALITPLILAAKQQNTQILNALYNNNANVLSSLAISIVNATSQDLNLLLTHFIVAKDLSILNKIITFNEKSPFKNISGQTLLTLALNNYFTFSSNDNERKVTLLLAYAKFDLGLDVNAPNKFDQTPLSIALQNQKPELVSLLLQNGAKITFTDLISALKTGNLDLFKDIFKSVQKRINKKGMEELIFQAVSNNQFHIAEFITKILYKKPHAVNKYLFLTAIKTNNLQAVRNYITLQDKKYLQEVFNGIVFETSNPSLIPIFVNAGANPNEKIQIRANQLTLLGVALLQKNGKIAAALIENGADISAPVQTLLAVPGSAPGISIQLFNPSPFVVAFNLGLTQPFYEMYARKVDDFRRPNRKATLQQLKQFYNNRKNWFTANQALFNRVRKKRELELLDKQLEMLRFLEK